MLRKAPGFYADGRDFLWSEEQLILQTDVISYFGVIWLQHNFKCSAEWLKKNFNTHLQVVVGPREIRYEEE